MGLGLKKGYFIGSFYLPERNWPIIKGARIDRFINHYLNVLQRNGLESSSFGWFSPKLSGDHEYMHTCALLRILCLTSTDILPSKNQALCK